MTGFCYSDLCNARISAFLANPADPAVVPPCRRCRTALEDLLGVYRDRDRAPSLGDLAWDLRRMGAMAA